VEASINNVDDAFGVVFFTNLALTRRHL